MKRLRPLLSFMMKKYLFGAGILLIIFVQLSVCSLVVAATLSEVSGFGSNPGNLRMFKYLPETLQPAPPLVVALHGCAQSASSFDDETGWTGFADKWGFALLLPEQKSANNQKNCFNWFLHQDIKKSQGEALSVKQMIDLMISDHRIDPDRIYVMGFSAGGAMTAALLAVYPEIFEGGAIIAGLPYKCATGLIDALNCMYTGKNLSPSQWGNRVRNASAHTGRWPRVSIWHGTSDYTVQPVNAVELMEQWTNVHGIDQVPDEQGEVGGYPYKLYENGEGKVLVETYHITGMRHGMPVDPGPGKDQCGSVAEYILDVDICSSYRIAKFWEIDVTPEKPKISLISPIQDAEFSGTVTIKASTGEDAEVTHVEFWVDNKLRRADYASPWQMDWDTSIECNGLHTLSARAFRVAGKQGRSEEVPVKVTGGLEDSEPPSVNVTFPNDGDTVHGMVTLSARAADDCRVEKVEFFIDGNRIGSGAVPDPKRPLTWEISWDTTGFEEGTHSIKAKAFDWENNKGVDDDTSVVIWDDENRRE